MTVRELIIQLQQCNPDAVVFLWQDTEEDTVELGAVDIDDEDPNSIVLASSED